MAACLQSLQALVSVPLSKPCLRMGLLAAALKPAAGMRNRCNYMSAGPRRTGEGTEDEEQGIIAAESTATG